MSNEDIVKQIRETGDPDRALILQLYEQNNGLIKQFVRPYVAAGLEQEDALQQAYFAVVEAVEHYDPEAGALFSTCLMYWVRATVGRELQGTAHTKRIPAHMQERIAQYKRFVREHEAVTGSRPADSLICRHLNVSPAQLENLRRTIYEAGMLSLSEPLPGADDPADTLETTIADSADRIQDTIDRMAEEQAAREIWAEVDALGADPARVIRARYADGLTRQAAAEKLNKTPAGIQRAEGRALRDLQHNKTIKRIARDFGYTSRDLYGGSLSAFRNMGSSAVEWAVLKHLNNT